MKRLNVAPSNGYGYFQFFHRRPQNTDYKIAIMPIPPDDCGLKMANTSVLSLLVLLCCLFPWPGLHAAEAISISTGNDPFGFHNSRTWTVDLPQVRLDDRKIMMVTFPYVQGLTAVWLRITLGDRGKELVGTFTAPVSPLAGKRIVSFDLSDDPQWSGEASKAEITLVGVHATVMPPIISFHHNPAKERAVVFARNWVASIEFKGSIVNVLRLPTVMSHSMTTLLGIVWVTGSLSIMVIAPINKRPLKTILFVWSFICLLVAQASMLPAQASTLSRLQWMKGSLADSLGSLPGEASEIAEVLKNHDIDQVGVISPGVSITEQPFLRYALLPVRVNLDPFKEQVIIVYRSPEVRLGADGTLRYKDKLMLTDVGILDRGQDVLLVRGTLP